MSDCRSPVLEHKNIGDLTPAPRNARTHSKKQIRQIADSIERFGFTTPALIDDKGMILAGHGRVAAARLLKIEQIPCLRLSTLSDADKRAYLIADNKLALNAGWDLEILSDELQALIDIDYEVVATGFEAVEVDQILCQAAEASPVRLGPEDDHPEPAPPGDVVTKPGDLWLLGRHALLCGDAKDLAAFKRLLGSDQADMVFTDPPYNLRIGGNVSGLGRARHREFFEASGEMTPERFTEFLTITLTNAAAGCRDGAIAFVCMDWRHLQEALAAGAQAFSEMKNLCVWSKTNGGMGTFYRSQHELILVWKAGSAPHTNTFGLGDKGRYRTNVWSYAGVNTFKSDRMEELAAHPTVKPVALVADAIRDVTHRGEIVLDMFGGSGTTLIAAQKTGRRARLVEVDPGYCDVTIRRWTRLTGQQAILEATGEDFEAVQGARSVSSSKGAWANG